MRALLAVTLLLGAAGAAVGDTLQDVAETYVHEAQRTRAVAIARVTPEGTERAVAGPESIKADSLFEIGSVTKVFTGVLLAEMVLREEVTLETTVGEVLGGTRQLDPAVAAITLRELATHTSGLPRLPPGPAMFARIMSFPADPYRGLTTEGLFDDLAALHSSQLGARGESQYSNFGMAVLGRLLEQVAGVEYEQLLRQRVLEPLGLDGMDFTEALMDTGTLITGHRSNLQPTRHWHLSTYAPAGGLAGSLNHLEVFLAAAMNAAPGSAMALAIDERLGWAARERDGEVMIWHNGQTGGFHSFVGFIDGGDRGVVVLSNTANSGDRFAVSILQGEPQVTPASISWVPLGFTVLFAVLGPLILFANWRQASSRLHVLDGAVATAFLLAMTWKLGIWTKIPVVLWYLALIGSVVLLGLTLSKLARVPWIVANKPWSTVGKSLSAALFAGLTLWAVVRL